MDTFAKADDSARATFDVRERHDGPCGGDPQTVPRMFTIQYGPLTGAVLGDAGTFERGHVGVNTPRPTQPRA